MMVCKYVCSHYQAHTIIHTKYTDTHLHKAFQFILLIALITAHLCIDDDKDR